MQKINTVVIGGGQAGLAISEHLNNHNIPHIIFEEVKLASMRFAF